MHESGKSKIGIKYGVGLGTSDLGQNVANGTSRKNSKYSL